MRKLEIEELPAVVVMDSTGDDLYISAVAKYKKD
ncbi:MAG: hypothetical protein ACI4SB_08215 [Acutalibacteraceae bacterium]